MEKPVRIKTSLKIIKGRPDLTPLVDVLFLLMVFVLLSSSFVQISGIKVELPETLSESVHSVEKFAVIIDRNSKFFFNDQPLSWEELKQQLNDLSHKRDIIIIRADTKTPFGVVAKLLGFAEAVNLNTVLVTSPSTEEKVFFKESENE